MQEQPAVAEVHRTTGDATHLVKVNVPDMATLEKIVDDLSETGARCQTTVVLSSPVPYRPITPPEGLTVQRSRLPAAGASRSPKMERTGRRPSARAGHEDGVPPRRSCSAGTTEETLF